MRKLSHEIAPVTFEKKSLRNIFETLLESINSNKQFNINFEFDEAVNTINDDIQLNPYRILQGQVKNILKYSGANALEIKLTCSKNAVKIRILDNGRGFDTKKPRKGIGLNNIKNRAESFGGKFILNSAPGMGCEIIVEIPVESGAAMQLVFK